MGDNGRKMFVRPRRSPGPPYKAASSTWSGPGPTEGPLRYPVRAVHVSLLCALPHTVTQLSADTLAAASHHRNSTIGTGHGGGLARPGGSRDTRVVPMALALMALAVVRWLPF